LSRRWRADPWLGCAFVALAVVTVVPIWIGRYLPLLDLPNHLSAITLWHSYQDPRFDFARHFALNLQPVPYWAHYYVVHLLAYLVGVENGNRVFLTGYALLLPTAAALFAERFGKSPWLALFAFPLVWNFNLAEGFIAYVAGIAVTLLVLLLVDSHGERPTLRSGAMLLVAGSLIYFFHILAYVFFLVCGGLFVLARREPFHLRRLLARGAPVVGCAVIGAWAFLRSNQIGFGPAGASPAGAPGGLSAPVFMFDPLSVTLARLPERVFHLLGTRRETWVMIVLALSWLAIAVTGERSAEHRREPVIAFLVALALAIGLPRGMLRPFYWYMINGRFAFVAALFGALAVRGAAVGWRRWLFVPVAAAGLFYAADLARMVVVFNRHVAGFDEVVAQIPLHRNTLTLPLPPLGDPEVQVNCFNQWGSYTQIRRGGYNAGAFTYGFPFRYSHQLPAPPWNRPELFEWAEHARGWDYFLTHNEGAPFAYEIFPALAHKGLVELTASSGSWKLWHKLEADPPASEEPPHFTAGCVLEPDRAACCADLPGTPSPWSCHGGAEVSLAGCVRSRACPEKTCCPR
jgi:hypothetical protein